jgi:predicted enzyme involved in methoxymalonyl-ACP biosynthesis
MWTFDRLPRLVKNGIILCDSDWGIKIGDSTPNPYNKTKELQQWINKLRSNGIISTTCSHLLTLH